MEYLKHSPEWRELYDESLFTPIIQLNNYELTTSLISYIPAIFSPTPL